MSTGWKGSLRESSSVLSLPLVRRGGSELILLVVVVLCYHNDYVINRHFAESAVIEFPRERVVLRACQRLAWTNKIMDGGESGDNICDRESYNAVEQSFWVTRVPSAVFSDQEEESMKVSNQVTMLFFSFFSNHL